LASITLKHVSVAFPIYDASSRSLKKHIFSGTTGGRIRHDPASSKVTVVQALEDINLDLRDGARVGLIGHNGAGKTTLLRVLAGIFEPAVGSVEIRGHAAPLFDIQLGMDHEATGYDNIELRGLFLGMTRRQIRDKLDEIAEFTELGDFLDLPIRTYSAGMRMRLAFAVTTSIDPDILLIDEGIGAGDAAFLEKADKRLNDFTSKAAIVVLASHSESLVRKMCDTSLLMERGRIKAFGPTDHILDVYRNKTPAPGGSTAVSG
jgi:ABC-2 type transport system ATP-binding protein/lipopolysaccharide transport system ATP-binding protein